MCKNIILKWRCIKLKREISSFNCRSSIRCKYDRDDVCNFQTLVRDSSHPPQVAVDEGGKGLCMKEEKIKELYLCAFKRIPYFKNIVYKNIFYLL